jgi:uncharacterized membrane protein
MAAPASLGKAAGLWTFLHVPGLLSITPQISVVIGYALIPWVGVMAADYALGALLERPDRRKRIFLLGIGLTLAFFLLRFLNLYGNGDPSQPSFFPWTVGPWKFQANPTLTVIAFFNTLKYPPCLRDLAADAGDSLLPVPMVRRLQESSSGLVALELRVKLAASPFHLSLFTFHLSPCTPRRSRR